ncbi:alpha amylase C-terminal domain-containing protein [candidate division WOR-3 bacterium]|nr:alpha amylase C-terminal domain-containing protein [candidate division WOR-3 bacterium]
MKRVLVYMIVLILPIMGSALTPADVYHSTNSIFYVNPSLHQVKIRLKQSSATEVRVYIETLSTVMPSAFQEDPYEYFAAIVPALDVGTAYHFIIKTAQDSLRIPQFGEYTAAVPAFTTPSWSHGKVYYSIFPDGFFNGDPKNDPEKTRSWGSPPHKWDPYGGDLIGIRNKLAYIESLGVDIILLQPLFIAGSYHKFDPEDFTTIDPHFGDTTTLKNLITDIHRRAIKIVCSMPFSHTGRAFPTFEDIEKNEAASKYLDWYRINTLPIKTSPPTYECWRNDPEFPKLNLSNAQVANYLLGYLEYWKHFGIDGFYIGEDSILDPAFIQTLRMNLKPRYPEVLLIGSDKRLVSGSGFDGCSNRKVTEVLTSYFIDRTMTTSEFDRAIRKLLFFNPGQVNSVNLLRLSDHNGRRFSPNPALQRNLYAFMMTWVGSPVIMFGDEVGMTSSAPLNCGCFPWDGAQQNRSLLEEIKKLVQIRKANPALASTTFYSLYANDINQIYAYDRGGIIVIINNSDKESFVELPSWSGVYADVITGEKKTAYDQRLRLTIGPQTYQILKREF